MKGQSDLSTKFSGEKVFANMNESCDLDWNGILQNSIHSAKHSMHLRFLPIGKVFNERKLTYFGYFGYVWFLRKSSSKKLAQGNWNRTSFPTILALAFYCEVVAWLGSGKTPFRCYHNEDHCGHWWPRLYFSMPWKQQRLSIFQRPIRHDTCDSPLTLLWGISQLLPSQVGVHYSTTRYY